MKFNFDNYEEFIDNNYKISQNKYKEEFNGQENIYLFLDLFEKMNIYPIFPQPIFYSLISKVNFKKSNIKDIFISSNAQNMKKIYDNKFNEMNLLNEGSDHERLKLRKYFHFELRDYISDKYKIKPMTNALLKCIELLNILKPTKSNVFHLCELPGGFIYAFRYYYKKNNLKYNPTAQSLNPKNYDKRAFGDDYGIMKEEKYDFGIDNTGDLLKFENVRYYIEKYKDKYDVVTSDCGIDCRDWNIDKERKTSKLYLNQALVAISILKNKGNYFFKFFSSITYDNYNLLSLCLECFEKVSLVRTLTTKPTSIETYVICEGKIKDPNMDMIIEYDNYNLFYEKNDNLINELTRYNTVLYKMSIINMNRALYTILNTRIINDNEILYKHTDKMREYYENYYEDYFF